MWSACNPVIRKLLSLLADGEHGTARQVHADIGFVVDADPSDRLLDPALGAGAMLDMGIYPLTFAHLVLGEPERLSAVGNLSESGIDLDVGGRRPLPGRRDRGADGLDDLAAAPGRRRSRPRRGSSSSRPGSTTRAGCAGPRAGAAADADGAAGDAGEWIEGDEPVIGRGYGNEIVEVHRCLRAGALTSDLVPPAQTISLMRQLDDVLAQVGVHRPPVGSGRDSEPEETQCRRPRGGGQPAPLRPGRRGRRRDGMATVARRSGLRPGTGDAGQQRRLDRLAR